MTAIANKVLDYMQQEYKNRIANNSNMTDDGARIFSKSELSESLNTDSNKVDIALTELKDYGYIQKWITGKAVLIRED